jgi:hypothetical protein
MEQPSEIARQATNCGMQPMPTVVRIAFVSQAAYFDRDASRPPEMVCFAESAAGNLP